MKPLVSQLWPQFMADPDFAACFGQVIVEHARMLRQDRQVEFTLRSAAPLDQNLCARLLASLQPDYEGFELKIKNLFGYAMLDEHALRTLLEDMKRDGVPINGFLDRCTIQIVGQKITIGVCHGTKFLQEMHFEKLLAERIAAHTGVTPQVTLQSTVSEAEQHQLEEKLERKIAPPVVKFEKKNTAPSIKVDGLDLTDKPVTIFHGKMFTPKNLTPLKDLGGEGGKCVIWGDVFFSEVKGNFRKIYTVSITDYQGSINLKIRAQEGEDCFIHIDRSEEIYFKLCFGLLHGRKLHRTGNAKTCTVDYRINFGLFLDDLLHGSVDGIFIGHIDRQMGDALHGDISAAELVDNAAVLFQRGCRAPPDAGASAGNNDDLVVFCCHDFLPENVDLVRV